MALNQPEADYDLPCGRSLAGLWDRLDAVERGRADEHELTCPHCSTALRGLGDLRAATGELRAERPRPSRDLTERIMAAVRAEPRTPPAMLPLDAGRPGRTEVSDRAVAAVVRFAVDAIDGVRARRCLLRAMGVDEDGTTVVEGRLTVTVTYGADLSELLAVVRHRAAAACTASVGVRLSVLDIDVADVDDR
ncbi:anti-sigma factor [Prauserella endophytica]|uniref:Asp23/Gls24 family envelope stress response protein n=1 Tax=Prauserella endophytica TaxID=1592324 RepID=A0ABY2SBK6_9PSEU|nr:Asp23/Gls24 family envelope stress response protein [Prauserella endophytica]TKG72911.1 Asp23/Gls24 family envelope stress response protein [Prauserella endophytica]